MKILFLFLFICTPLYSPIYSFSDLSDENIVKMRQIRNNNSGEVDFRIGEGGGYSFQDLVGWGEKLAGQKATVTGGFDKWSLIKPVVKWAVGGTVASYGAGFYLVYRAYSLLNAIGSWTSSASYQSEEDLILYVRKTQKKMLQQKYLKEIKKEKEILSKYLKIHVLLCRWHIRKLFLYDRASHRSIVKSYKRLCALERHLCKS